VSHPGSHRSRRPTSCSKRRGRSHKTAGKHNLPASHSAPHAPSQHGLAADSGGSCADTTLSPTQWDVERVRAATLCLVNRERTARGESPLQENARLEQAAQDHTESMAFGDYFEHVGPGGDTPLSRMRAAGYIFSSHVGFEVGENIGWGTLSEGAPQAIVAAWMASPGHRANILDGRYRDTAIGVSPHVPSSFAHGQSGGIYTQDFGVITGG
jgi:uncharacterized protein YkwD